MAFLWHTARLFSHPMSFCVWGAEILVSDPFLFQSAEQVSNLESPILGQRFARMMGGLKVWLFCDSCIFVSGVIYQLLGVFSESQSHLFLLLQAGLCVPSVWTWLP